VFGNRNGKPLRESKLLQKVLQPAAEAAGLGRVTWHHFRHIHSSLLNDLHVPVKIAQEQLGHSSICIRTLADSATVAIRPSTRAQTGPIESTGVYFVQEMTRLAGCARE
jgi:Phage integrase family